MSNLTDTFLTQLQALSPQLQAPSSQLPAHCSLLQAKRCLLDYLGATLAGADTAKEKCVRLLDAHHSPDAGSRVIGHGRKATPAVAALVNGYASHAVELDDGVRYCSIHPGGPVFSALLAAAEVYSISGEDVLRGAVVGYEAAVRIGRSIQPAHRNQGFHATGTCGCIGAALGVAAALRMNQEQMKTVLTAAATSASGMLAMMSGQSELKAYNSAHAAAAGFSAAMVGQTGFTPPDEIFDGPRGFLRLMSPETQPDFLTRTDTPAAIHLVYVKPYAACRHCHAPIEAALHLREVYGIRPQVVERIEVETYQLAAGGHDHAHIEGVTSAKMSTPYSVAVALLTGKAGLNEFTETAIHRKDVLDLAQKVTVSLNQDLNALVPHKRPALLTLHTRDGQTLQHRVDIPKGEPETALTDQELEEKFTGLAQSAGITQEQAAILLEHIRNVENDLGSLLTLL